MPRVQPKSSDEDELDISSTPNQGQSARKRHVCPTCDRCFTTSGHLARHSRVHTGEKNHKCPFPGCDTRCSRQDNLQQHYRIHLSPGSRRTSARSSASRRGRRGGSTANASAPQQDYALSAEHPPLSPPPLVPATLTPHAHSISPPPLETARGQSVGARTVYDSPPDSPPPLAHATVAASYQHVQQRVSPTSSATSSPEVPFAGEPSFTHSTVSVSPPPHSSASTPATSYAFRNGATTYQEQATSYSFGQNSSASPESFHSEGYVNSQYSLPRIDTLTSSKEHIVSPSASSSISASHSRHSISHISHSQSQPTYQRLASSRPGTGPPSPASSHSASHSSLSHSGPPTPSGYTTSPYEVDTAHSGGTILGPSLSRYSPPPVLAPIHGFSDSGSGVRIINEQYERKSPTRGDYHERYSYASSEPRYGRAMYGISQRSEMSPIQSYMPHPSAIGGYNDLYSSSASVNLNHGGWKTEHLGTRGMKSIDALVQ